MTTYADFIADLEAIDPAMLDAAQPTPSEILRFLKNEVAGACNKANGSLSDLPPQLCVILLIMRKIGRIRNPAVKQVLVEYIHQARNVPG